MDELGCSDFLYDGNDLLVDDVFKVENLNEMFVYISGKYYLFYKLVFCLNLIKYYYYSFYYRMEESK